MPNTVSALNGANWSEGIAKISEAPLQGMITLRGDLSAKAIVKAVTGITGVKMPNAGEANCAADHGLCWMSPDEVLILCPYADVASNLETLNKAFAKLHALAVDVSDARAKFCVSGQGAREVMAKLAPVDVSPDAFLAGTFRRTRMAQVPAAFWMQNEGTFEVICFRSNAQYMFDLLKVAAQPGSGVDYF